MTRQSKTFIMLTAVAAVVVLWFGECLEAGTFQISSVEYLTDTSKSTSVTLVSIGAVARYVGPTDSNDNAWALETQLLSGGTTYTGSPQPRVVVVGRSDLSPMPGLTARTPSSGRACEELLP